MPMKGAEMILSSSADVVQVPQLKIVRRQKTWIPTLANTSQPLPLRATIALRSK